MQIRFTDSNMAQVLAAGLAEVLRDHEDKISAAQAWCEQQNISSIHELKGKGDAAIDEFISAAGLEEFLHQFLVKRRIGDYAAVAPAPAVGPGLETETVAGVLPHGARLSRSRRVGPRSAHH